MKPSFCCAAATFILFCVSASATTDLPSCQTWQPAASCNYTAASRPSDYAVRFVVIHKAQGTAASAASWFQNCAAGGSAHYSFDSSSGYCYQSVREKDVAWHAGYWNTNLNSIGIEHGGYISSNDTATACYDASAVETRACISYYGVANDRAHIIGHSEVPGCGTPGGGGTSCHTDPGAYWNWSYYMSRLNPGTPWDAAYSAQSYPTVMAPGQTATMWLEYRNKGTSTWTNGANPVRLATSAPRGSTGYLYSSSWISGDRACAVGSNVAPGAIGRFTFTGKAPTAPGYYISSWELVCDGVSWFEGTGDNAWFGTNVAYQGDYVRIQAEDFANGPNAVNTVDYWDKSAGNAGGAYRSTDCDIKACLDAGGGYCVGWTEAGEWMRYWYNANAGDYTWTVRYANGSGVVQQSRITVDGTEVGRVDLFPTASYDTFSVASAKINIATSGIHSIGLDAVTGGVDFNWFDLQRTMVIVDNSNAGFSCSSNWSTSTADPDKLGLNNRARATGAVSDAATFTYSVPTAGNYNIWAWWTSGANRSASAPFVVSRSGGTTTVYKNQQANGGSWQLLGTFALNAGTNTVKLSCWTTAGYYVIADAIAVAPQ